jgi:hypothetical protein
MVAPTKFTPQTVKLLNSGVRAGLSSPCLAGTIDASPNQRWLD